MRQEVLEEPEAAGETAEPAGSATVATPEVAVTAGAREVVARVMVAREAVPRAGAGIA